MANPDIVLLSPEPHPRDASLAIDPTAARPGDVRGEQTQGVRLPADSGGSCTDQEHAEDEHLTAINDWLTRVCPVAGKPEKGTSETVTEASSSEILSPTGSVPLAYDLEDPNDQPPPVRHRSCAKETADSIRAMRDVAASNTHQSIARHSCQSLLQSARRYLWLAISAVLASFALQNGSIAAPKTTFVLALIALLGGVRWTVLYFSATKELSAQHSTAFVPQDE